MPAGLDFRNSVGARQLLPEERPRSVLSKSSRLSNGRRTCLRKRWRQFDTERCLQFSCGDDRARSPSVTQELRFNPNTRPVLQ
jgi:hypothetical protein